MKAKNGFYISNTIDCICVILIIDDLVTNLTFEYVTNNLIIPIWTHNLQHQILCTLLGLLSHLSFIQHLNKYKNFTLKNTQRYNMNLFINM